jgi:hypothetical protein
MTALPLASIATRRSERAEVLAGVVIVVILSANPIFWAEADVSSPTLKYAVWEGDPVVMSDSPFEAWVSYDGKSWRPAKRVEVGHKAGLVPKDTFDRMFPELPALPSNAFHSGSVALQSLGANPLHLLFEI